MNAEGLQIRSKQLSISIIRLFQELPKSEEARLIGRQLLGSSTAVAANYRAACRARSQAEFLAKLSIVVEEVDETLFWLELLTDAGVIMREKVAPLYQTAQELLYIFSSSRKTVKNNLKANTQSTEP